MKNSVRKYYVMSRVDLKINADFNSKYSKWLLIFFFFDSLGKTDLCVQ